ncbi:MAG: hypothetical protein KIS90_04870, partial [Phenylobacterium sp.]|nr:hypothetical protein [Phenylobacterium sp.]
MRELVMAAPQLVEARDLLTRAYHRSMNFEACAESARVLLAISPDHRGGGHYLAQSLYALGDQEGALATYEGLAAAEATPGALEGVAALSYRLGRIDAARTAFAAHLTRSRGPGRSPALFGLMRLESDAGDRASAERARKDLAELFHSKPVGVSSYLTSRLQAYGPPEWFKLVDKG